MEDLLYRIQVWASHGSMKQFSSEVIAKVQKMGMEAELVGNTLTCYKTDHKGGFLGMGAKKTRRIVLQITRNGNEVDIAKDTADPEFVEQLSVALKQH
ncbi:MAG: hypothetical protein ACYC6L_07190 [Anaerolineae bacterium]